MDVAGSKLRGTLVVSCSFYTIKDVLVYFRFTSDRFLPRVLRMWIELQDFSSSYSHAFSYRQGGLKFAWLSHGDIGKYITVQFFCAV